MTISTTGSPNRRRVNPFLSFAAAFLVATLLCTNGVAAPTTVPITFNATALSAATFTVSFSSPFINAPTDTVATFDMEPREYRFNSHADTRTSFAFTVTASGTVEFDPSHAGYVSGAGTSTLTVTGLQINIDPTLLATTNWNLGGNSLIGGSTAGLINLQLLPGTYPFSAPASSLATFLWEVKADRTVDFAPALDGYVQGRGSDTLVVIGRRVYIDARSLDGFQFNLGGSSGISGFIEEVDFFQMLPGPYGFNSPASSLARFNWTVDALGQVDYDPALDFFVGGRESDTLIVLGTTILIDARALSGVASQYRIEPTGVGTFPTATIEDVTILPAVYRIRATDVTIEFLVDGGGLIDYDENFESVLLGRGSNTLVILGDPADPPTVKERLDDLEGAIFLTAIAMVEGALRLIEGIRSGAW